MSMPRIESEETLSTLTCGSVELQVRKQRAQTPARTWEQFCIVANRGLGGVVIVPKRSSGEFLLVRQFRPAIGKCAWEFPRGFCDTTQPLDDAARELREETALNAGSIELLGWMTPDSGLLQARVAITLARIDDPEPHGKTDGEVAAVRWITAAELRREIAAGALEDGFTLASFALACALGH